MSHALNGRPGVSEETRERVRTVAAQPRWEPSSVARALSGSRAGAIGWVTKRSAKSSIDPYFMEFSPASRSNSHRRWDRGDQFPNGRQLGTEWLSQIRAKLDREGLDTHR